MNPRRILIPVTCFSLIWAGWAYAGGPSRTGVPSRGTRIDGGNHAVTRSGAGLRGVPARDGGEFRGGGVRVEGGATRGRGNSGVGAFRPSDSHVNGTPGGLLEQLLYNEYGGHRFDPYAGEKAQAKAYRDAAIANAIVNVVGILATAGQPQAPPVVCPAPPQGHIERQQVLVQEGRTEEYDFWVPEYTIPATGEVVVGHHETRRRTIAPVYEEREIWVPTP